MRDLISLVDDKHEDNKLKKILVYVFFGLIVNNWPKNVSFFHNSVQEMFLLEWRIYYPVNPLG